jgi:SNARE associated Golgi protein
VSPAALRRTDALVARYGAVAVLLARLLPFTAFDLLSYAAGLTPLRLGPFLVAPAIGMTPATFLMAWAGDLGGAGSGPLAAGTLLSPASRSGSRPAGGHGRGFRRRSRRRRADPRPDRDQLGRKYCARRWRRNRRERWTRDFTAGRLISSISAISGFDSPSMSWRTNAVR